MGKEKKKYRSGQATSFITRGAAIRKLQLNLVDFRRLCILKGIYPVQPSDMKKAGRGNKQPKTYFRTKDIQFLSHEPIIWKFRAYKTYKKKLRKAIDKREKGRISQLVRDAPRYKLDHIVKE
ncbi:putative pescadillo, partial [Apostichopus japonicus]